MNTNMYRILFCAVATINLFFPQLSNAEIEGNCTMCHKYPGLGRIDSTGENKTTKKKRIFYINNDMFDKTYHGAIRCKSCHIDVTKIPHTGADKVDCATDCHIIEPSSNKSFSHKKIVNDFNKSVHGIKGSNTEYKEDLPVCKDCHSNKIYHIDSKQQNEAMVFLSVCEECHTSIEFPKRFYEHITYRTLKRRPSKEVVKLCSTCHADETLMSKHKLDVVIGFANTFHAKALFYGNTEVPNCLNCHAPYQLGFSPHRISSKTNDNSPTNSKNKLSTCSQSGCHIDASENFASAGYVHPSPKKIEQSKITSMLTTDSDSQQQTKLKNTIIGWIQTFYKILIALVVGGLGIHRLLDVHAARRERNNGEH